MLRFNSFMSLDELFCLSRGSQIESRLALQDPATPKSSTFLKIKNTYNKQQK